MREAVFLQFLTEFLTQDKFGDIVKDYKLKKSSDEIKLNVVFDLTKLKEPTPILQDKGVEISDSKVVEEVKEVLGVIEEPKSSTKEEPEVSIADVILGPAKDTREVLRELEKDYIAKSNEKKIGDIFEEKKKVEPPKEKPPIPLSKVPTMTSDENGNVIIGGKVAAVKPTNKENGKNVTQPILSNEKSLYKDHYFSDEEVMYLNAYLNKEITGAEGAELLGLKKPSDFYNLVQRFKRSKNISGSKTKRSSSRAVPSLRAGQKMTNDDLALAYEKVSKGETNLASMARQFGVATSTMSIRMHKYIDENKLKPLFSANSKPTSNVENDNEDSVSVAGRHNPALDGIDYEYVYRQIKMGDTMAALAKDYGVPENSLTKRFKKYCDSIGVDFHVSAIRTPLRPVAKAPTAKPKITIPAGTSDGWQVASDNKFHLVKKGVIVE